MVPTPFRRARKGDRAADASVPPRLAGPLADRVSAAFRRPVRTRRQRSSMSLMDVETGDGDILNRWHLERSTLDVEITVGHVWMRFSGHVTYLATTELVRAHADGELSISLFFARTRHIEPRAGSNADYSHPTVF